MEEEYEWNDKLKKKVFEIKSRKSLASYGVYNVFNKISQMSKLKR